MTRSFASRSFAASPRIAFAGLLITGLLAACDLSALEPPVTPSPTAVPTPTPVPSFVRPTPTPLPTFLVYVVAPGDTLSSIATMFATKAQSIAYWNRASYPSLDPESPRYDPNTIQVGWTLVLIPFGQVDPEDLPPPAGTPSPSLPSPRSERLDPGLIRSAHAHTDPDDPHDTRGITAMTDSLRRPRIVVTVADPLAQPEPSIALRRNALYAEAVFRHGADPIVLDASAYVAERVSAFESMDGLLLSGGADLDPALYGETVQGARDIEPDRDALEAEGWSAAVARSVPILGLCRGLQAINVFSGGTLLQHVDGHVGAAWGHGPAATHPLRVAPGSVLGGLVGHELEVNSYHHQGIRPSDLAPGLVATAWADSSAGPLIEGVEGDGTDGRFIVGVQCHPERTDTTPDAFERLFAAFVEAAGASRR